GGKRRRMPSATSGRTSQVARRATRNGENDVPSAVIRLLVRASTASLLRSPGSGNSTNGITREPRSPEAAGEPAYTRGRDPSPPAYLPGARPHRSLSGHEPAALPGADRSAHRAGRSAAG